MFLKHFFNKRLRKCLSLVTAMVMLAVGTVGVYADTANNVNKSGNKKNSAGEAWRSKEGVGFSLDLNNTELTPQYYDPYTTYSYGSYSFLALQGLGSEAISTLTTIFERMVSFGFTEEMAAGACGNLWQECDFNYKEDTGGSYGLLQWSETRKTALDKFAEERGTDWTDLNTQIDYMFYELENTKYYGNNTYLMATSSYLYKYGNHTNTGTVKDVQSACDAWCAVVEGCTCYYTNSNGQKVLHKYHNEKCAYASDGISYQHLNNRRDYAERIYDAMVRVSTGEIGGKYAGKSQAQIFDDLYGTTKATVETWSFGQRLNYTGPFKLDNDTTIYIHKLAGDDLVLACNELLAMGYPLSLSGADPRDTGDGGFSFHSCGLAIDVNYYYNPCKSWRGYGRHDTGGNGTLVEQIVYQAFDTGKTSYPKDGDCINDPYNVNNPKAVTQKVANVFRAHGWLWGRDFTQKADMMHFSLGEVTNDLCNEWITSHYEGASATSKSSSSKSSDDNSSGDDSLN